MSHKVAIVRTTEKKEPRPGARNNDLRSNVEFSHANHQFGHDSSSPIAAYRALERRSRVQVSGHGYILFLWFSFKLCS